jgi:hypothetical protein
VGKAAKAVLAVLVLAGAAAGISYATNAITRTATSTLQACTNGGNGDLRLVSSPSDCRANETAVSWNVVGPAGKDGADGKDGTNGTNGTNGIDGKDGANGVSPVVAQLAANDPNCSTGGGVSITDGLGHVGYVCNGAKGDTGASGTPFSGAFESPSHQFAINVSDNGITLKAGGSKITLGPVDQIDVDSASTLRLRSAAQTTLDGGASTSVSGGIVNIGSGGCAPPLRLTDITGAFVVVPFQAGGAFPVTFPGLAPATDVCVG